MKAQEQLQTTAQPIQHRVARILRKLTRFYEHIGLLDGNLADCEPYASSRDLMHVDAICKDELVDIIDEIKRDFSKTLISELKRRVWPYAPYFEAFDLVAPTASDKPVIYSAFFSVRIRDSCEYYFPQLYNRALTCLN